MGRDGLGDGLLERPRIGSSFTYSASREVSVVWGDLTRVSGEPAVGERETATHMALWSKVTSVVLVIVIGAMMSVLYVIGQGSLLRREIDEYPRGSTEISLYDVSEAQTTRVLDILGEFATADEAAIVRVDQELSDADGSLTGMRVGVMTGDNAPAPLTLDFLGTTLVDIDQIADLARADPAASIGLDANAADVIHPVPELLFASRFSVVQLARLVETSGTVNGAYRVSGANEERLTELLSSLESATGLSSDRMLAPLRGHVTDSGMSARLLQGFVIATALLLLLVLVFEAVRAFRVLGVHLLLGRSRLGFAVVLLRPVVVAIVATIALSMIAVPLMAPGYSVNPTMLAAAWSAAVAGVLLPVGCVAIAALALVAVKPVDAIAGRFSRRILLGVLAGIHAMAMAGFTTTFIFLDGPMKEAGTLAGVSESWAAVADQEILYQTKAGEDEVSFAGQSGQYQRDFYDWYTSIADARGVGLVNSQYVDRSVLDVWSGVYQSVPERPFWYVVASPNALASQGFAVDTGLVERAEAGERVFLIPDSWTGSAQAAVRGWLGEHSDVAYEPAIRTAFFDDRIVTFQNYHPAEALFPWSTNPAGWNGVTDAVILVTTPENMIPFESESLAAVGLDNSYVKLSRGASKSYANQSYLSRFDLDDNGVEYLPVGDFVAGLTKSIQSVVQLFGVMILFLGLFCLLLLTALMRLYSTTYRESMAVKRMLGYSSSSIFAPAFVLVGVVCASAVTAAALSSSRSAILGIAVMSAAQLILFVFLARTLSRLQLTIMLKD